jgi:cytochrome c
MKIKLYIFLFSLVLVAACAQDSGAPSNAANASSDSSSAGDNTAQAADGADFDALLAAADAKMGQRQYIVCQACHSTEAGGPNKVGPNLHGVIGRAAAQADGFVYSAALTDAGIVWDAASLNEWIASPATLVPGTTMVFAGIRDPEQRANLIAYLQQVTTE